MRLHTALRFTLLLVGAASPALVIAQFQTPTSEELNMTSDAKAPGAAAVFLNIEEITDDPHHLYSFYARIKVLKDEGKKLATVEVPYQLGDRAVSSVKPYTFYASGPSAAQDGKSGGDAARKPKAQADAFKVDDVKARTIHSDGTVIPLAVRPDELLKSKSANGQLDRISFALPGVEVGSILEYRYTVHYDEEHFSSPFWQVQRPYFVHKAHYAFTPFNDFLNGEQNMTSRYLVDARGKVVNSLIWWPVLPQGVSVQTDPNGRFSLDVTDITAIPHEEWMPPVQGFAYHVLFYYKHDFSGSEFWANEEKLWSKDVDRFAEPTAGIRQAVASLVAPGDGGLEKAKKVYEAVEALENTDHSSIATHAELVKSEPRAPRRAEDVWSQKSGSSEEIALLYLAMLRAAGLAAYDMKVVDRDKGVFSSGYLSFDQFDDDLIILDLDGKEIFLDPGEKVCPFQTVHWKHAGASGIRQTAKGAAIATSPLIPYTANALLRAGDVTIDGDNRFTGLFRFVMTGQEALYWRQKVLSVGQDEAKRQFDSWLESMVPQSVQAHFDHYLALENPELNLIAVVNAQGYLEASGSGRHVLPASFFEARGNQPFLEGAQRQEAVDMHYGEQISDQVVYHLPAGAAVETTPADDKISLEHYAAFVTSAKSDPGQINVTRTLVRAFTIAGTAEYADLRGFYQKVAAADRRQIVLSEAPTSKGN
jgi:hypothetical protein